MADQRAIRRIDHTETLSSHRFVYYDFAMAAFVTVLICSNLIGAAKLVQFSELKIGGFELGVFGAGILFFPLSYVLGDVLTEVYGYARARRVVWAGFAAVAFMAFMAWVVVARPPAPGWEGQANADAIVSIPVNPAFASINLAQAALIMGECVFFTF